MLLPRLAATTMQTRVLCSAKQPAQRGMTSRSKKPSRLAPAKGRGTSVHVAAKLLSYRGALALASMAPCETTVMSAKHLWRDNDGVILPYVAIMLGVIIGLSALALDGSRLMSVQTRLQNAADALALAGAAELDRRPDSIVRARMAVQDLIKNPISGGPGIGAGTVGARESRQTRLFPRPFLLNPHVVA